MSKVIVFASFKPQEGQADAVRDLLVSVMVGATRAEAGNGLAAPYFPFCRQGSGREESGCVS